MKRGTSAARHILSQAAESGTVLGAAMSRCPALAELLAARLERERSRDQRQRRKILGSTKIRPLAVSVDPYMERR